MSLGATTSAPARAWRDRGARDELDARVVVDAAVRVDEAAVAVVGVLAEADVGHDEQLGMRLLDRARRELDDALVVVGARALGVLAVGDPEEQHGGQARALAPAPPPRRPRRCSGGRRRAARRSARGPALAWTNSGRTRSGALSRVSRTRSRRTGVERSRRRRVAGKGMPTQATPAGTSRPQCRPTRG